MSLEGKIEILREMINGNIPPEDYPLEYQGRSIAALNAELLAVEQILEEFGPNGLGGTKERSERQEYAIHMAGHLQIKHQAAMAQHHSFVSDGFSNREELDYFGSMLKNKEYWGYLQKNDRERAAVSTQLVDAVAKMEPQERAEYFEANPEAKELHDEWKRAMEDYLANPEKAVEKWGADYFEGINDVKGANYVQEQYALAPEQRDEPLQKFESREELSEDILTAATAKGRATEESLSESHAFAQKSKGVEAPQQTEGARVDEGTISFAFLGISDDLEEAVVDIADDHRPIPPQNDVTSLAENSQPRTSPMQESGRSLG